jgi:hypothetical protein
MRDFLIRIELMNRLDLVNIVQLINESYLFQEVRGRKENYFCHYTALFALYWYLAGNAYKYMRR